MELGAERKGKFFISTVSGFEKTYKLSQELSWISNTTKDKIYAFTRLARWVDKVEQAAFKSFNTIARIINIHHKKTLNYFDHKSTNAAAESFRSQFRGVGDINFFLFRLTKLFA